MGNPPGENRTLQAELTSTKVVLDGQSYSIRYARRIRQPGSAPRLLIVSYLPNDQTQGLLKSCLDTIQRFTPEPHETWVIDNNSPWENLKWLLERPDVNLVLNRSQPLPRDSRGLLGRLIGKRRQAGSYANAEGLELGVRLIDPDSQYVMTLHMDTMPCHSGWLSFLLCKLTDNVAASGVRLDRVRTPDGVLHVLGYLVNFQLFQNLGLSFWPSLPTLDVGDRITLGLREAGYEIFACPNTLWDPQLIETLPHDSPFRNIQVDRALDDQSNVIFLHLGRGTLKSTVSDRGGTSVQQWLQFAEKVLLA